VGVRIATALDALSEEDSDGLLERRYERLRAIGEYNETD
jgi:acetyl-CoA carboxylase alpha subunit